jgi:hypothetical protein
MVNGCGRGFEVNRTVGTGMHQVVHGVVWDDRGLCHHTLAPVDLGGRVRRGVATSDTGDDAADSGLLAAAVSTRTSCVRRGPSRKGTWSIIVRPAAAYQAEVLPGLDDEVLVDTTGKAEHLRVLHGLKPCH